jgi:hypothetical protein
MLMSVPVEARMGGLMIGQATPLFNTTVQPFGPMYWALSEDGERVLVMESTATRDTPGLSVVVNWSDAARRR